MIPFLNIEPFTCWYLRGQFTILAGFNFTSVDYSDKSKLAIAYHRIAEAWKFAYAKRSRLGDQHFVPVQQVFDTRIRNKKFISM